MASQFPITYRATCIPRHIDRSTFDTALRETLGLKQPSDLILHSFSVDSSNSSRRDDRAATFSVRVGTTQLPEETSIKYQSLYLTIENSPEVEVFIDAHFINFTPLSPAEKNDEQIIE